jgi:hypothetical protein
MSAQCSAVTDYWTRVSSYASSFSVAHSAAALDAVNFAHMQMGRYLFVHRICGL